MIKTSRLLYCNVPAHRPKCRSISPQQAARLSVRTPDEFVPASVDHMKNDASDVKKQLEEADYHRYFINRITKSDLMLVTALCLFIYVLTPGEKDSKKKKKTNNQQQS